MNKQEQFLNLMQEQKQICGKCYLWDSDGCYCSADASINICEFFNRIDALYTSEPEQGKEMTICPECIPVPSTPASEVVCQCGHSVIEHFEGGGDVTYCEHKDGFYHCVCTRFIPVPSTPANVPLPDELLKEIKELPEFIEYRDAIRTQHNHPFSIEYMRTFEAEDKLISAILLKCSQSEAAIRADQNKKIGEDLTKILLDDTIKNSISRCRTITDYVADNLIAKLQKGDSLE